METSISNDIVTTTIKPALTTSTSVTTTIGTSGNIEQLQNSIDTTNSLIALLIVLLVTFVGTYLFYGFFRDLFAKF